MKFLMSWKLTIKLGTTATPKIRKSCGIDAIGLDVRIGSQD